MANRKKKGGSSDRFLLLGLENHCRLSLKPWNQKMIASWQESYDKPRQGAEKQRHYWQSPYSGGYGLPSGHVRLWELDCKESKVPKSWCLLTVVLEKTPESPSDSKEIKPVHPKGNQSWIFIGRTDAEAETPGFWSSDAISWLIEKAPDAGKDWGQKEKGMTEDEIVGWHHWLNGHEYAQTQRDNRGQGRLVCCSSWGCKGSDMTERLNWKQISLIFLFKSMPHPLSTLIKNCSLGFGNACCYTWREN